MDSNAFVDGFIPDQYLEWNGSNQLLIDTEGLGFDTADGNRYNPYPEGSDQALVFAPADTLEVIYPDGSHTHYSESYTLDPASTPVPEPSELLGVLALGCLGLSSRFQRRSLHRKNAN